MHKVAFAKAFQVCRNGEKLPFCVEKEGAKLQGSLSYDKTHPNRLKLKGVLSGSITLICDLSGEEYDKALQEDLEFYLSGEIVHLDSFEEVVECKGGEINFEEILEGELEMIRCDYHTKEY